MDALLFIITFVTLGILYFYLGIRASRNVGTSTDYYLANRSLGVWQISSNLIATQLGGGMLLGTAATAYAAGYYGILYNVGIALGFLLLACGIASRLQQFQVTTTAELFETRYGSSTLKQIASLLSIITLFGILTAQVIGFKSLMAGIGFGADWLVVPFWLSVVAYTMIGGLRAITINDMVQLSIITFTFFSIFIYVAFHDSAAVTAWFAGKIPSNFFVAESYSLARISSVILMPALFALIEQDLAQRFFASRSRSIATASALNAGIFIVVFAFIPVFFGMQTKIMNLQFLDCANPLIVFLRMSTTDLFFALALCAIVAAIISTADALINGISANITQDFKLRIPGIRNLLTVSKVTSLIVGLAALGASYMVPQDIIDMLISSYELSVCCLLVPLLFCYFKNDVKKEAAVGAIIAGLFGFVVFRIWPIAFPKELAALALSLVGYGIGGYLAKKG
jgi:SSS family solute:Na+ symporter